MFADDTSCTAACANLPLLIQHLNTELKKLANWFRANKMAVNISKNKFIIFHGKDKIVDLYGLDSTCSTMALILRSDPTKKFTMVIPESSAHVTYPLSWFEKHACLPTLTVPPNHAADPAQICESVGNFCCLKTVGTIQPEMVMVTAFLYEFICTSWPKSTIEEDWKSYGITIDVAGDQASPLSLLKVQAGVALQVGQGADLALDLSSERDTFSHLVVAYRLSKAREAVDSQYI